MISVDLVGPCLTMFDPLDIQQYLAGSPIRAGISHHGSMVLVC